MHTLCPSEVVHSVKSNAKILYGNKFNIYEDIKVRIIHINYGLDVDVDQVTFRKLAPGSIKVIDDKTAEIVVLMQHLNHNQYVGQLETYDEMKWVYDKMQGAYINVLKFHSKCTTYDCRDQEEFLACHLPVKGCRDLAECIRKLCYPEVLKGDNQVYCTSRHRMFDASRFQFLSTMPEILNFEFSRCVYDVVRGYNTIIDTHISYPNTLRFSDHVFDDCFEKGNAYRPDYELVGVQLGKSTTNDPNADENYISNWSYMMNHENGDWFILDKPLDGDLKRAFEMNLVYRRIPIPTAVTVSDTTAEGALLLALGGAEAAAGVPFAGVFVRGHGSAGADGDGTALTQPVTDRPVDNTVMKSKHAKSTKKPKRDFGAVGKTVTSSVSVVSVTASSKFNAIEKWHAAYKWVVSTHRKQWKEDRHNRMQTAMNRVESRKREIKRLQCKQKKAAEMLKIETKYHDREQLLMQKSGPSYGKWAVEVKSVSERAKTHGKKMDRTEKYKISMTERKKVEAAFAKKQAAIADYMAKNLNIGDMINRSC